MLKKQLSVIIPAWQAEKYIAEAINSVRNQKWDGAVELIVCNDGSTDRTAEIAGMPGVNLLSKARGGAASARNMGLKASEGEYIYFLDADDLAAEGALESLYMPMRNNPAIMAVFGRAEDFVSDELTAGQRAALNPRCEPYGGVLPGCALLRREIFDIVGIFDENLKSGETVSWQMKLRESGVCTVNIEQTVLKRRLHLANTGRLKPHEELRNYAALLRERMKKK